MAVTADERREVAARLRAMTEGQSPMAEYPVEMLFVAFGMPMSRDVDGALIGRIADLIEPAPKCSEPTPKCDRDALLKLADEMDAYSEHFSGGFQECTVQAWAYSIREVLEVVE